jgi:hypothetical protein
VFKVITNPVVTLLTDASVLTGRQNTPPTMESKREFSIVSTGDAEGRTTTAAALNREALAVHLARRRDSLRDLAVKQSLGCIRWDVVSGRRTTSRRSSSWQSCGSGGSCRRMHGMRSMQRSPTLNVTSGQSSDKTREREKHTLRIAERSVSSVTRGNERRERYILVVLKLRAVKSKHDTADGDKKTHLVKVGV